jgi:hypothetical protein
MVYLQRETADFYVLDTTLAFQDARSDTRGKLAQYHSETF